MIERFKETEMRDSGIIYQSQFEQIKKLYAQNKELAGELAISAIELVLTGEYSSNDFTIDLLLTQNKVIVDRDKEKYDKKLEAKRAKRIENMELDKIAEMLNNGATQKIIADTLGISTSTISDRVKVIRTDYPDLLKNPKNPKNPSNPTYDNDNDNVNDNVNDNDNAFLSSKEKSSPPSSESWGCAPNPQPIGFRF